STPPPPALTSTPSLHDALPIFGIGAPSTAANLARRLHAPDLVLIYESGTIGARPRTLPLSIGDGELAETAQTVVSVPEMFNYWLDRKSTRLNSSHVKISYAVFC